MQTWSAKWEDRRMDGVGESIWIPKITHRNKTSFRRWHKDVDTRRYVPSRSRKTPPAKQVEVSGLWRHALRVGNLLGDLRRREAQNRVTWKQQVWRRWHGDWCIWKGGKGKGKGKGKGGKSKGKGDKGKGKGKSMSKNEKGSHNKSGSSSAAVICFNCGKPGHMQRDCRAPKRTTAAAATRAKEKEETKVRTRVSTTWKKTTNKTWSRNRIPRVSHFGCHFGRPRKHFERYVCGEPHTTKYKTASGELLEDHGQVKL